MDEIQPTWLTQAMWGPRASNGEEIVARVLKLREALSRVEPAYANLATWLSSDAKPPMPLDEIAPDAWAAHFEQLGERDKSNGYISVTPAIGVQQQASLTLVEGIVRDPALLRDGELPDERRLPNDCLIETSVDGRIFASAETLRRALEVLIHVCEPEVALVHVDWPPEAARIWLLWTIDGFDGDLAEDAGIHLDAEPHQTGPGLGGTPRIFEENAPVA